jgi:hypothetical protein
MFTGPVRSRTKWAIYSKKPGGPCGSVEMLKVISEPGSKATRQEVEGVRVYCLQRCPA